MNTNSNNHKRRRFTVKQKFIMTFTVATCWLIIVTLINIPWIIQLSDHVALAFAALAIVVIAIIPSFWYSFTLMSFLIDTRPPANTIKKYPGVSVLIAAYNEEKSITQTVASVVAQEYPGDLEIIVIDDGSTDSTVAVLKSIKVDNLVIIEAKHQGKAGALNEGLKASHHELIITIDADTYLLRDSVKSIVAHLLSSLPDTAAVAGSVCVRNSRENIYTKIQEWNYFNEFVSQKRVQSLFQSTLVAQGAFSVYASLMLGVGQREWVKTLC